MEKIYKNRGNMALNQNDTRNNGNLTRITGSPHKQNYFRVQTATGVGRRKPSEHLGRKASVNQPASSNYGGVISPFTRSYKVKSNTFQSDLQYVQVNTNYQNAYYQL